MIVQALPVRCLKCSHAFKWDIPVRCMLQISLSAMKHARCTKCGAGPKHLVLDSEGL